MKSTMKASDFYKVAYWLFIIPPCFNVYVLQMGLKDYTLRYNPFVFISAILAVSAFFLFIVFKFVLRR